MKRIVLILPLILLVACASPATEAPVEDSSSAPVPVDTTDLEAHLIEKDIKIAALENQIQQLTDSLTQLQSDYDDLVAGAEEGAAMESSFLCENRPETMKYQNPASTIAILEGWFALQPNVQEKKGDYTTIFWKDLDSRMHTVSYQNSDGQSDRVTFLIFFSEAGWEEGVLNMTDQCWLDYPGE